MKEHIRYLSEHSPFTVSCIPNAGLPENVGGVAHYRLTPVELKMQLMHFVEDLGVQVIGGCCGTTPAHIGSLAELAQELKPAERPSRWDRASCLLYTSPSPRDYAASRMPSSA